MKGSEPFVQWNNAVRIVYLEILVMQIVSEAMSINGAGFGNNDFIESRVVWTGRKAGVDNLI